MNIKVIVDNIANKDYLAQHGLSMFITSNSGKKILFDTGQSELVLKHNYKSIVGNEDFNTIILSHGHYDHTNGLKYFINTCTDNKYNNKLDVPIYIHKDGFLERYYNNNYIGIDKSIINYLNNYDNLYKIEKITKIEKNIILSGTVKREYSYYEKDNFYYIDNNGNKKEDLVIDDMFLIVDNVLITGCSHSGIINTVEYAKSINKNIIGVVGGFHLGCASNEYINNIYNYFKNSDLEFIMPMHCTGFNALKKLSDLDIFKFSCVGMELTI